jgi:hypothetical protein
LHTSWPIPVGILVGAGLGIVLVYYQLVRVPEGSGRVLSSETEPDAVPGPSRDEQIDRGVTD